jgi:hypothetical protein
LNVDELQHRFRFHARSRDVAGDQHALVREGCLKLALLMNDLLPDGREKAIVMTHLEDAMMWANAGIARSVDF